MKKKLKFSIFFLIAFLIFTTATFAKGYIKDLFQAGEKVKINEELDGTAFLAGNKVEVLKPIKGISFIAGNDVSIGAKQQYIFTAGANIDIEGEVLNDSFIAGSIVKIKKESKLSRDAYIFAEDLTIEGTVDRNIYIYGSEVTLSGTFNGNVTVLANTINAKNATIKGKIKYNEDASVKNLDDKIKKETFKVQQVDLKSIVSSAIKSFIQLAILSILLVFLFEKIFKKFNTIAKDNIWKVIAIGLAALIGVPIVSLMLLFTGFLAPIGVILGILFGIIVYLSNIFSGYVLGIYIDKKFMNKSMNKYISTIIGLALIFVLSYIPYIGGLISFISMITGIGLASYCVKEINKKA